MPRGLPDSIIYTQMKKASRRSRRVARESVGFFEALSEILWWMREYHYRAKARKVEREMYQRSPRSRVRLVDYR